MLDVVAMVGTVENLVENVTAVMVRFLLALSK